jgi:DNA-binding PadR family transcriptional regulator
MDDVRHFLPLTPQQFHILLALTDGDRHGYGMIRDIADRTEGAMRLGTGTLYTAVARLESLGLIGESDGGAAASGAGRREPGEARPGARNAGGPHDQRRRYYRLTPAGRAVLEAETGRLEALVRHARRHGVEPLGQPALLKASRSR